MQHLKEVLDIGTYVCGIYVPSSRIWGFTHKFLYRL